MGQLVRLQVTLSDELRLANITSEGALASVGAHMSFKVTGLSEFFETVHVGTNQNFRLVLRPRNLLDVL